MSPTARVPDRLKRSVQAIGEHPFGAHFAHLLSPATQEDLERRRGHLLALLLVAVVWSIKHVTGLTDGSAQYTVYGLAIALAAIAGGLAPAAVATMAAVLLANVDAPASPSTIGRVTFALEGLGLALLVGGIGRRLRETAARLATADGVNQALTEEVKRARISHDAFEHLGEVASDAAAFVVNAHGLIVEWPRSAVRMYGFTEAQALGSNVSDVLEEPWRPTGVDRLPAAEDDREEPARRVGVHRRSDGTPVHVEFAIRRCGLYGREHFTVAVQDLSRRRETDAFREAAQRAQTALQRAADDTRAQLETLEALTDPAVIVAAGTAGVDDLLDRLRSAVRAEGVALVRVGRTATRVVAAAGLQPVANGKSVAPASGVTGDGRVALVHNDAARVAQVSALQWPPTVSSILVVPVRHSGPVAFRIEVVNERRAPASEWDLALARIVAERLAAAMLFHTPADSADAVA
jgi:PAS domain S-box-containing protein